MIVNVLLNSYILKVNNYKETFVAASTIKNHLIIPLKILEVERQLEFNVPRESENNIIYSMI